MVKVKSHLNANKQQGTLIFVYVKTKFWNWVSYTKKKLKNCKNKFLNWSWLDNNSQQHLSTKKLRKFSNLKMIKREIDRLKVAMPSQNIFLKKVGNANQPSTTWILSQHYYRRGQIKSTSHSPSSKSFKSHQHQIYNQ